MRIVRAYQPCLVPEHLVLPCNRFQDTSLSVIVDTRPTQAQARASAITRRRGR